MSSSAVGSNVESARQTPQQPAVFPLLGLLGNVASGSALTRNKESPSTFCPLTATSAEGPDGVSAAARDTGGRQACSCFTGVTGRRRRRRWEEGFLSLYRGCGSLPGPAARGFFRPPASCSEPQQRKTDSECGRFAWRQ
ncbi:hypothetical protein FQA47_011289 [Oryzias melastigma]|uniref:Uncharacterized protein n=1 Tax=Oryzias melastigma TaxID=30732 RepID=A0A834CM70_ORYME|nr:hypothetical protein FQA47_011289 [Oryzias melastigma]